MQRDFAQIFQRMNEVNKEERNKWPTSAKSYVVDRQEESNTYHDARAIVGDQIPQLITVTKLLLESRSSSYYFATVHA